MPKLIVGPIESPDGSATGALVQITDEFGAIVGYEATLGYPGGIATTGTGEDAAFAQALAWAELQTRASDQVAIVDPVETIVTKPDQPPGAVVSPPDPPETSIPIEVPEEPVPVPLDPEPTP